MMQERVNDFLKELTDLTHKYNLIIRGRICGGMPYIAVDNGKVYAEDLEYVDGKYIVESLD